MRSDHPSFRPAGAALVGLLLGLSAAAGAAEPVGYQAAGTIAEQVRDVYALAFSPDGKLLAAGGADHRVRLYRVPGFAPVRELDGHLEMVRALVFSPDGRQLVSGACDDSVLVWAVPSGERELTFAGQYLSMMGQPRQSTPAEAHRACVTNLALTADGKTLASGSNDRSVRLWDLAGRKPIGRVNHDDYVAACDFRPRGDLLAFSDFKGLTVLFDRRHPQGPLRDLQAPRPAAESGPGDYGTGARPGEFKTVVRFLSDDRLVTGGPDGGLRVWDVAKGEIAASLPGEHGPVFALARHPTRPVIASGHQSGAIVLWDVAAGRQLCALPRPQRDITSLAFSADGDLLASANHGAAGIRLTRLSWPKPAGTRRGGPAR